MGRTAERQGSEAVKEAKVWSFLRAEQDPVLARPGLVLKTGL